MKCAKPLELLHFSKSPEHCVYRFFFLSRAPVLTAPFFSADRCPPARTSVRSDWRGRWTSTPCRRTSCPCGPRTAVRRPRSRPRPTCRWSSKTCRTSVRCSPTRRTPSWSTRTRRPVCRCSRWPPRTATRDTSGRSCWASRTTRWDTSPSRTRPTAPRTCTPPTVWSTARTRWSPTRAACTRSD